MNGENYYGGGGVAMWTVRACVGATHDGQDTHRLPEMQKPLLEPTTKAQSRKEGRRVMSFATKVAVLKRLAKAEGVKVPSDVIAYLAGKAYSERALEGLLLRLIAFASLMEQGITIQLAEEVLKGSAPEVKH